MSSKQRKKTLTQSSIPKLTSVKCLVWDLDNTLWKGILLEDETVTLRLGVVEIIQTLDRRGILHSIASKNDYAKAMHKLEQFGLSEYFLYPQINWDAKSISLQAIAQSLNINLDTLAFVDDQPFELDEVSFLLPQILCIDSAHITTITAMPAMMPRFITTDSRLRHQMYLSDTQRVQAEKEFTGSNEAFLATLGMIFTITPASKDDLQRAEELTIRTHQLNTTGHTYSYEELDTFRQSPYHKLLISRLEDKYGTYGTIGLVLVACNETVWNIKLLLMSCRVMSRGVGTIMLNYIMRQAKEAGVQLQADFVPNDYNRMMYITYKFSGFQEVERQEERIILHNNLTRIQPFPDYVRCDEISIDASQVDVG